MCSVFSKSSSSTAHSSCQDGWGPALFWWCLHMPPWQRTHTETFHTSHWYLYLKWLLGGTSFQKSRHPGYFLSKLLLYRLSNFHCFPASNFYMTLWYFSPFWITLSHSLVYVFSISHSLNLWLLYYPSLSSKYLCFPSLTPISHPCPKTSWEI